MYQSTEPCPHCGAQNLRGTWVCPQCGMTLLVYCPNCRAGNVSGSQFCHSCGSQLTSAGQSPDQTSPAYPQGGYQEAPQGQNYYQQTAPGAYGDQQPYQPYQDYAPYDAYQQPYGAYGLPGFTERLKHIVRTTNPILLSSLVVLVVGLVVFLMLAFQLGWIKTGASVKKTTGTNETNPPVISLLQVKESQAARSAIVYWVTDEYSSTQVEYGIWPYPNNTTAIESDPQTGVNEGVLIHQVTLNNLIPRTAYAYRVISIDKYGNKATSPIMQFDTGADSGGGGSSGSGTQSGVQLFESGE